MSIKNLSKFPCQILELNLSCFGCCRRDWKSKKLIFEDLNENTKEFNKIKQKSILRLLEFRDRLSENPDDLTNSGLCSNLIQFKNNIIACPLHPQIQKLIPKSIFLAPHKKDLRVNHCDINYECETFKLWKKLSKTEKEKFIEFIKKEKQDPYSYSIKNVNGVNVKKYLKLSEKNKINKIENN